MLPGKQTTALGALKGTWLVGVRAQRCVQLGLLEMRGVGVCVHTCLSVHDREPVSLIGSARVCVCTRVTLHVKSFQGEAGALGVLHPGTCLGHTCCASPGKSIGPLGVF